MRLRETRAGGRDADDWNPLLPGDASWWEAEVFRHIAAAWEDHDREKAEEQVARVTGDMFTSAPHTAAWGIVTEMLNEGGWPSLPSVSEYFTKHPRKLSEVGGWEEAINLFGVPSYGYIRSVKCPRTLHEIVTCLLFHHGRRTRTDIIDRARVEENAGRTASADLILEELDAMDDSPDVDNTAKTYLESQLTEFLEIESALHDQEDRGEVRQRIASGFADLDNVISSWDPGSMYIIGGNTGAGKSSVMLTLAHGFATKRALRSSYLSLEDGDDVIRPRIVALWADVSQDALRLAETNQHARDLATTKIDAAQARPHAFLPVHTVMKNATLADIKRAMTRHVRKHECKVAMVDYIQAIRSDTGMDRRHELKHFASSLKAHADKLGVPLILGSQLRRPKKGEETNRPTKYDLRDCGELEEAAEAVLMPWVDGRMKRHLFAAKVKNGTGTGSEMNICWDGTAIREFELSFDSSASDFQGAGSYHG